IKLEGYSPFKTTGYGYDAAMHGVELVEAQYNKQFHPGSDDLPEMAKERVPSQVLTEFTKIVNSLGNIKDFIKDELAKQGVIDEDPIKAAKIYGIAYMNMFVNAADQQTILPEDYNSQPFYNALPSLDHMDTRTGREVYISKEELSTFS